jgi:hypothetical protein
MSDSLRHTMLLHKTLNLLVLAEYLLDVVFSFHSHPMLKELFVSFFQFCY